MHSKYSVHSRKFNELQDSIKVPTYQRRLVWGDTQKQNFIDNVSNGFPFGSILLYRYDNEKKLTLIDGLQRFSTIRDYQKNPSKYFTNYSGYVKKIISLIEEANNTKFAEDAKNQHEIKISVAIKKLLSMPTEQRDEGANLFFLYNEIKKELPMLGAVSNGELAALQIDLIREADNYLDVRDIVIPTVEFEGEEDQLPEVFANLNQGGTKLTKYQVLSAQWSTHDFVLNNSHISDQILEKVIKRYEDLVESRQLEIEGFDAQTMKSDRKINLAEYCYAMGGLIIESAPVFWGVLQKNDIDSLEDKCNVIGYLSVAIALGVDVRTLNKLINKKELSSPLFVEEFSEKILEEYQTLQNIFEDKFKIPGTSGPKYETTTITDMQTLSFFASLWHRHYTIDSIEKKISVTPRYKDNYERICKNLVGHCIADIVSKAWQGSGDSRLANYYVKGLVAENSYISPIKAETLYIKLSTWYEDAVSTSSVNPEKISKMLLCVFTSFRRSKYTSQSYDIEHIIPKKKFQKLAKNTSEMPGGMLGNLMYLDSSANRSKRDQDLYHLSRFDGLKLEDDYINQVHYPNEARILNIFEELAQDNPDPAKGFVISRGKEILNTISKEIGA